MKKRLISFLLCFAMIASMLPMSVQAVAPAGADVPAGAVSPESSTGCEVWDGTTDTSWYNYRDFTFYLDSAAKFAGFAKLVNGGEDFSDVTVYLTVDIDLNNNSWTPIGEERSFAGTFDGGYHSIYNLQVYGSAQQPNLSIKTGLFGFASSSSTVKNIILVNGSHTGANHCGGIVGVNYGIIENCTNYINIKGGNFTSSAHGYGDTYVGGIVGQNRGYVIKCTNYGNISSLERYVEGKDVGGVVGHNLGHVINCTNYGSSLQGGIVGTNEGIIDSCINRGSVEEAGITYYNREEATVRNCINYGTASRAGISAYNYSSIVYNCANMGSARYGIIYYGYGTFSNCYNCGEIIEGSIAPSATGVTNCYAYENYMTRVDVTAGYTTFNSAGILGDGSGRLLVDVLNEWVRENGADYLGWYVAGQFPILAFNGGIGIKESTDLYVGDSEILVPNLLPGTIIFDSLRWSSNNTTVATVNEEGKVVAVAPGTAVITVATADGKYSASCSVSVKERIQEYKINSITVRDDDGAVLSEIPVGSFLATVSITNVASEGNTLVFLASYTAEGQYQGMMWVSVEDLPIGATIKITLPVDNSDEKIANLTAFVVASFSNLTPLGGAVSFLP